MRGGDHASFGLLRLLRPDGLILAVLQHAEELRLKLQRRVSDLVEEDRSLGRDGEASAAVVVAPVNEPRTCPKSSDSSSVAGSAAQLTGTKGAADCAEFA